MEISYTQLLEETLEVLDKNRIWVLSTSHIDIVTSRSMSIINIGLDIYFQTGNCYVKHNQMAKNKNVSLCWNNISIEGIAEEIGNWKDERNQDLLALYKEKHKASYEAYGMLEVQVVYKVKSKKVKYWKYMDGKPVREVLHIDEKRAERLNYI